MDDKRRLALVLCSAPWASAAGFERTQQRITKKVQISLPWNCMGRGAWDISNSGILRRSATFADVLNDFLEKKFLFLQIAKAILLLAGKACSENANGDLFGWSWSFVDTSPPQVMWYPHNELNVEWSEPRYAVKM
jgi:hypothetical protein